MYVDVDPKQLDPERYMIVDPEQTDPEQYATSEDEDCPPGVFPHGLLTTDARILWGVVAKSLWPVIKLHEEYGGCYQSWALDDQAGEDESAG